MHNIKLRQPKSNYEFKTSPTHANHPTYMHQPPETHRQNYIYKLISYNCTKGCETHFTPGALCASDAFKCNTNINE